MGSNHSREADALFVIIGATFFSPAIVAPVVSAAASFYHCGPKAAAISLASCTVTYYAIFSWYISTEANNPPPQYQLMHAAQPPAKSIIIRQYVQLLIIACYFWVPAALSGIMSLIACGPYAAMVSFGWTMIGIVMSYVVGGACLFACMVIDQEKNKSRIL